MLNENHAILLQQYCGSFEQLLSKTLLVSYGLYINCGELVLKRQ